MALRPQFLAWPRTLMKLFQRALIQYGNRLRGRLMRTTAIGFLSCTVVILISPNLQAQPARLAAIRIVALTGTPAPGVPSEAQFNEFDVPLINTAGNVTFRGTLSGFGVDDSNDQGIWSEGSGTLSLVARTGNQASGTLPQLHYAAIGRPYGSSAEQIAFYAELADSLSPEGTASTPSIWRESLGSLGLVALAGTAQTGTVFESGPGGIRLSSTGQISFHALGMFGESDSIWSEASGLLNLVTQVQTQVPGQPAGVEFLSFSGPPLLGANEQTTFKGFLTGPGIGDANNQGLWAEQGGTLTLIVREGDHAPGTPDGVTYNGVGFQDSLGDFAANDTGQIAFRAMVLDETGVNFFSSTGIWTNRSGTVELVALSGDQVPGMPDGTLFGQTGEVLINAAGQIQFGAAAGSSIWLEDSGSFTLIARRGDQAPELPNGINIRLFPENGGAGALNAAGQSAFSAIVEGVGIDATNNLGIWATDRAGNTRLILRKGDLLNVSDDPLTPDMRTVSGLSLIDDTANADLYGTGFNDHGRLAFLAYFTDGTEGIFVSNLVAIPEPSSMFYAALAALFACGCKQRVGLGAR